MRGRFVKTQTNIFIEQAHTRPRWAGSLSVRSLYLARYSYRYRAVFMFKRLCLLWELSWLTLQLWQARKENKILKQDIEFLKGKIFSDALIKQIEKGD